MVKRANETFMAHCRNAVRLLTLILASALFCPTTSSAEEAPRNTKPFTRFKILLSSSFFNDSLPFDVPFIIWGDIPETSEAGAPLPKQITLRIAEIDDGSFNCNTAGLEYGPPQQSGLRKWTATDYSDRGIPLPTDLVSSNRLQFEFMLQKLEPKKTYCFLFQKEPGRRLTPSESLGLGKTLVSAYRGFLQRRGTIDALGTRGVEDLRQSLITALFAASPLEGLRARPGTVFDKDANAGAVFDAFRTAAARVLDAHNDVVRLGPQVNAIRPTRPNEISEAENFTRWLGELSRLQGKIQASLRAAGAEQDLNDLMRLPRDRASRLLLGVRPQDAFESLEVLEAAPGFVKDPGAPCPPGPLGVRCGVLESLRDSLARLEKVVDLQPLAKQIRITRDDIQTRLGNLRELQEAVNLREERMLEHLAELEGELPESILVLTTTLANLETRRRWYLSMDTGIAVGPTIDEVFPYIGTNMYFRPINTEAPPGPFLTRFSVLYGVTWTDNLVKEGERQPLYGESAMLLFGVGLRLTDVLRLGGGAIVIKSENPDPTIDRTRLRLTPFVALSADIDLAGVLGKMFGDDSRPPVLGGGETR